MAHAADLLYSETERDLAAALADLLADRAAARRRHRAHRAHRRPTTPSCGARSRRRSASAGLLIPEALGGAGASYRELAAAAEQFGAAVAPIPYLGSAAVATAVLLSAADSQQPRSGDRAGGRASSARPRLHLRAAGMRRRRSCTAGAAPAAAAR